MLIKRILAYILDVYLTSLVQLIIFSLYRFADSGVFRLSMFYVVKNFWFLYLFLSLFYFFTAEYFFQKTVGKKIFKLEVIFTNRNLKSIFIRTVIRLIPIDVFFILIYRKTLHDILSKTVVMRSENI